MGSGYKKILLGIFMVTFHINLGPIQIVPPVFGWLVVTFGVTELLEAFPNTPFRNGGYLAKAILFYTLITSVVEFFNPTFFSSSSMLQFSPVIYGIIHLLFAYQILEGSILYVRSLKMEDLEKSFTTRTGTYIILYVVNMLVLSFSIAFHGSMFITMSAITGIILNIWFMMMMSELGRLEVVPSVSGSDQDFTGAMEPAEDTEE
jgi:hypothetical protein